MLPLLYRGAPRGSGSERSRQAKKGFLGARITSGTESLLWGATGVCCFQSLYKKNQLRFIAQFMADAWPPLSRRAEQTQIASQVFVANVIFEVFSRQIHTMQVMNMPFKNKKARKKTGVPEPPPPPIRAFARVATQRRTHEEELTEEELESSTRPPAIDKVRK